MASNKLLDFLQGASNAAASNVSAPVDGLAWLLRKAGINVGDAPVGGSDWMRQRGLTAEPTNKLAGLLGESVGGVAPMLVAAKAPQIAQGLLQAERNLAAPRTLDPQAGAILWHGSPHKFDAFDASKIGTGEGVQAYGHGLYLAESPEVAKSYKNALTHSDDYVDGKLLDYSIPKHFLARVLSDESGNVNNARDSLSALARPGGSKSVADSAKQALKLLDAGERPTLQAIKPEGSLYKVDLPDEHIAKMLDWDKPLSQQSAPKESIDSLLNIAGRNSEAGWDAPSNTFPSDLLSLMSRKLGGQEKVAEALRQQGIPGIRYLDGGSRGTGAGTSNYVVFPGNENLLSILERNGQRLK